MVTARTLSFFSRSRLKGRSCSRTREIPSLTILSNQSAAIGVMRMPGPYEPLYSTQTVSETRVLAVK